MTGPAIAFGPTTSEANEDVLLLLALEEEDLDALDARVRLGEDFEATLRRIVWRDGRLDLAFHGAGGGVVRTPLADFLGAERVLAELVYVSMAGSSRALHRPTFVLRLELSDPRCRGPVVSWAWRHRSTRAVFAGGRSEGGES